MSNVTMCDTCGSVMHGWFVSREAPPGWFGFDGKHFCCRECARQWLESPPSEGQDLPKRRWWRKP